MGVVGQHIGEVTASTKTTTVTERLLNGGGGGWEGERDKLICLDSMYSL